MPYFVYIIILHIKTSVNNFDYFFGIYSDKPV